MICEFVISYFWYTFDFDNHPLKSYNMPPNRGGCRIGGSVIGFSRLSGLNPLTNLILNKNIKIISFIY
jgi:hypothetical protein